MEAVGNFGLRRSAASDPAKNSAVNAGLREPDQASLSPFSCALHEALGRLSGFLSASPFLLLMLFFFVAPLICVLLFSLQPAYSFSVGGTFTLENFRTIFEQNYWRSLLRSCGIAAATVGILLVLCYPLAFALARTFAGFGAAFVTFAIAASLFIPENIRLFGWVIGLMKGGVVGGILGELGIPVVSFLYNIPVILLGMVTIYFPFMLFPLVLGLQLIPQECREAAYDLGASRWQVFTKIDLPLAMPGVLIGSVLVFVLSVGAIAEAKILGGQKIVTIAADIESSFTFAQNWPLGSALAALLVGITMFLVFALLRRIDLDRMLGKKLSE